MGERIMIAAVYAIKSTEQKVQSYIGHRSLVMTCNTYGHRYPGSSRVEHALSKFIPGELAR